MTDKLPPLPDLLEKAIAHFAQACLYSDVNARRASADQLKGQIQEYARQAVRDAVPEGFVVVSKEIIDRFPEINPSNYDHDDACNLNAWGVELVLSIAAAKEAK